MTYDLEKVLLELKSLREHTPIIHALPSDDMILQAEKGIGLSFSDDYKKFLKEASNVTYGRKQPLMVTGGKHSSRDLLEVIDEARQWEVPDDWIPICEDNGDYFCIAPDGQIRFWDHNGATDEAWPDLATWIKEVWIEGN